MIQINYTSIGKNNVSEKQKIEQTKKWKKAQTYQYLLEVILDHLRGTVNLNEA